MRTTDIPAASKALLPAGFVPAEACLGREPRCVHESGLPIELHDRMYRTPFNDSPMEPVFARARTGEVIGIPVRLIGDIDLLVHAPVHASVVPQREGLSWVIDVVSLLRRRKLEGAAIDWAP